MNLSVIIPTYRRERVLLDTLEAVTELVQRGDEIVIIDQTGRHEPATEDGLRELAGTGKVRWFRRARPHICAAMNAGALLARNEMLLFLDDDVIPDANLLEAHRRASGGPDAAPAVCGQVLQPWHTGPVSAVRDFALEFDAAYDKPCEILTLMAGNFSTRRETFLRAGGFDENFSGPCYRLESELAFRLFRTLGRKVAFAPGAMIRHLKAGGGTRAFGDKDSWQHIGGSVGDYYFALRSLPLPACLRHSVWRLLRAPITRATVQRPWRIPSLFLRELAAWWLAVGLACKRPGSYVKDVAAYGVTSPLEAVPV